MADKNGRYKRGDNKKPPHADLASIWERFQSNNGKRYFVAHS
ncbi:hypothetical protein SPONL_2139 [uncultured Candidatus Thioglobus sp.]|nr:hypothetical protein SPONL_2139 [uncultured Candidatus Thioglobus sp.]